MTPRDAMAWVLAALCLTCAADVARAQQEVADPADSGAALESGVASDVQSTDDVQASPKSLVVSLAAGAGVGTRGYVRPVPSGAEELETTPFAAIDVALMASVWPQRRFGLELGLRYQTSVGMTIQLEPPFALPERLATRSERLEVGIAPVWRLSNSPRAFAFAFPVNFNLRMFWPEVRETVPGWYLLGPNARVEVIAPLGEAVDLRFGPELFWVAGVHPALRADGTSSMGVGAGMQASIGLRLGEIWALELCYREAHAWLAGVDGAQDFRDSERFATLRVKGAL